jgi:hypothetical protein
MNTDTISTGIIAVDYSKSLQNMMADGSYDWVNPAITSKGFPITAVGIVQFETKVFHFNRYISSEDAVCAPVGRSEHCTSRLAAKNSSC